VIYVVTSACVLALVAFGCAVAALTISWRHTLAAASSLSRTDSSLTTLATKLAEHGELLSKLKSTAPADLAARVVELSDAVARLAKTQQRFAGKYYAEGKIPSRARDDEPARAGLGTDDPEFLREWEQQIRGGTGRN